MIAHGVEQPSVGSAPGPHCVVQYSQRALREQERPTWDGLEQVGGVGVGKGCIGIGEVEQTYELERDHALPRIPVQTEQRIIRERATPV